MAYGDFKDLLEEQFLTKHYVIKHLILLKIQYDGYQCGLASLIYEFFDNKVFWC